jgi:hypothetical protein
MEQQPAQLEKSEKELICSLDGKVRNKELLFLLFSIMLSRGTTENRKYSCSLVYAVDYSFSSHLLGDE